MNYNLFNRCITVTKTIVRLFPISAIVTSKQSLNVNQICEKCREASLTIFVLLLSDNLVFWIDEKTYSLQLVFT